MSTEASFNSLTLIATLGLMLAGLPAFGETVSKTYKVKAFHCPGCAHSVETVLKETTGVKEAKADFAEGKVEVSFEDDLVTEREIQKAIEEAGFSIVKPDPSGSSRRRSSDQKSTRR